MSTRRVGPHDYTDDMRYDDEARPYSPASTASGRRSSRNIASVERPNVRRRSSRPREQTRGGRGGRSGGLVGQLAQFLSDPRRALFLIVVLLAVVLTAILTFSVSSCVSARNQPSSGQVVPVGSAQQDDDGTEGGNAQGGTATQGDAATDSTEGDSAADGEADQGDSAADGEADGTEAEQEPKETVVEVSVARGSVSWVEITCDGESVIADSVTGPWSESYTVHDSITVQVANPDAVTVTENGEKVDFSSHAGGLGSLTIEGTPLPEEGAEEAPAEGAE